MAWIIGILPEGQLNPNPDAGLLPIYFGAYSLCRMSKRLSSIQDGSLRAYRICGIPLGTGMAYGIEPKSRYKMLSSSWTTLFR
jgi:hypothetical protein